MLSLNLVRLRADRAHFQKGCYEASAAQRGRHTHLLQSGRARDFKRHARAAHGAIAIPLIGHCVRVYAVRAHIPAPTMEVIPSDGMCTAENAVTEQDTVVMIRCVLLQVAPELLERAHIM